MSFVNNVGTASVSIEADSSAAESDIRQFLRSIELNSERTTELIEAGFESMGRAIEDVADEIADDFRQQFAQLTAGANLAGEQVENAFAEAARQSDAALSDIGGINAFGGLVVEAEIAGSAIESIFNEAQNDIDDDLQDIGGPEVWAPLVLGAQIAGHSVRSAFSGITFSAILGPLGTVLSLLGETAVGAAAAGGALSIFGLDQAANMEQLEVAFTGLLGSTEAAQQTLEELRDFAATTPFSLQGLTENAQQLLAMSDASGITRENLIPTLSTIGNLGSLLGATPAEFDRVIRAFSQMDAKGKVSREELLQLTEAFPGFPVFQELAEGLGITTEELDNLLTEGAIPATEGIAALLGEMESFPGAAGAMEAQSQTLSGAMSNFFDTISTSLADAFTPIIPTITEAIQGVLPLVAGALEVIVPPLSDLVTSLLPVLAASIGPIAEILAQFFTILAESVPEIAPLIPPLLDALLDAFTQLAPVMPDLIAAFVELTEALLPLLIQLTPVLVLIIQGLTVVVLGLAAAIQTMRGAAEVVWRDVLVPFGNFLSGAFTSALNFVKSTFEGVRGAVDTVHNAINTIFNIIRSFVNFLQDTVGSALRGVSAGFEAAGDAVGGVTGAISGLIGVVRSAINFVGDLIEKITNIPSLPSFGGRGGLPFVPFIGTGGLVRRPTLAVVGDGGPELVLPLNNPARMAALLNAHAPLTLGGISAGVGGGGTTINFDLGGIHVTAAPGVTDAEARRQGELAGQGVVSILAARAARVQARIA